MHKWYTLNYTYRGLWGTLIVTAVLFAVSAVTAKTEPERLERTTVDWRAKRDAFRGVTDWRLQWWGLAVVTVLLYLWVR